MKRGLAWLLLALAFAGAAACIPSCNIPRERVQPREAVPPAKPAAPQP